MSQNYAVTSILTLIVITVFLNFNYNKIFIKKYNKYDKNNKNKYYVIHLEKSIDRLDNLNMQIKKLKRKVDFFPAVDGNELDYEELLNDESQNEKKNDRNTNQNNKNNKKKKKEIKILQKYRNRVQRKGVYGCYMSHFKLIEKLRDEYNNNMFSNSNIIGINSDYSIIFEDDIEINTYNLDIEINRIIRNLNKLNIDFDIIYLGDTKDTQGDVIIDNIYQFDIIKNSHMLGEAYVIKNESLDRIYNSLLVIDEAIDWKFRFLFMKKTLIGLMVSPGTFNFICIRSYLLLLHYSHFLLFSHLPIILPLFSLLLLWPLHVPLSFVF